jgi:hypothetical protein
MELLRDDELLGEILLPQGEQISLSLFLEMVITQTEIGLDARGALITCSELESLRFCQKFAILRGMPK